MALVHVDATGPVGPPLEHTAKQGEDVWQLAGVVGCEAFEVVKRHERSLVTLLFNSDHLGESLAFHQVKHPTVSSPGHLQLTHYRHRRSLGLFVARVGRRP
jgi:hypothetical protein